MEEMTLFVLGLLKDTEELDGQEESVPGKDTAGVKATCEPGMS